MMKVIQSHISHQAASKRPPMGFAGRLCALLEMSAKGFPLAHFTGQGLARRSCERIGCNRLAAGNSAMLAAALMMARVSAPGTSGCTLGSALIEAPLRP